MISGEVAYHLLKTESPPNAQTFEKIVALLKQHPEYGKFKLDAMATEDRNLYLFMLAAR